MPIVLNGTTGVTTPSIDTAAGNADLTTLSVAGNEISAVNSMGFRNRIINGDMRIDQRNAGASVTPATSGSWFPVDRFAVQVSQNSKLTAQQNAGSVTPPAGYSSYLGFTSSSAYSVISSDYFVFQQRIEGLNTADLAFGTASASAITLSFWVRSSLTGTFGGSVQNSTGNRCYVFSYTVSAANTWEQKTITIAGDTTGTWLTTNGIGLNVYWSLGAGTANSGTTGSWGSTSLLSATGATSVVGTSGATFYITGVQLEAGSVATPFERRDYGRELMMCQRYYYKFAPGGDGKTFGTGQAFSSTVSGLPITFPVTMRTSPSALEQSGTASHYGVLNASGTTLTCNAVPAFNIGTSQYMAWTNFSVASGLVAGNAATSWAPLSAAFLAWSAEL